MSVHPYSYHSLLFPIATSRARRHRHFKPTAFLIKSINSVGLFVNSNPGKRRKREKKDLYWIWVLYRYGSFIVTGPFIRGTVRKTFHAVYNCLIVYPRFRNNSTIPSSPTKCPAPTTTKQVPFC